MFRAITPGKLRGICLGVLLALSLPASSYASSIDRELLSELSDKSIRYFSLITGQEINADDKTWLSQHWLQQAHRHPKATFAELKNIAGAFDLVQASKNKLILPQQRNSIIGKTYCAVKQSADPIVYRLARILAPDSVVLASDCLTDSVVTSFDVAALAKSEAFIGGLVGQSVDVAEIESQIRQKLKSGFQGLPYEQQQRLLWGELRAAAVDTVWESADENTRQKLKAAAKVNFEKNGNLATSANDLELAALKKAEAAVILDKIGSFILSPSAVQTFSSLFQLVTGARLSVSDMVELQRMIETDFREDPKGFLEKEKGWREWMENGYRIGRDANGNIKAWTAEERAEIRRKLAANFYCQLQSTGDPDDTQLIQILFRHDPVISKDCAVRNN